jgi:hypothetical protein
MPRSGKRILARTQGAVFLLCLSIAGCKKEAPVTFSVWHESEKAVTLEPKFSRILALSQQIDSEAESIAQIATNNARIKAEKAYRAKVRAEKKPYVAKDVPKPTLPPVTRRTTFYEPEKVQAKRAIGSRGDQIIRLIESGASFQSVHEGLQQKHDYLRGLNLVGLQYLWQIESAIRDENYSMAIEPAYRATLLGFFLVKGSGFDASLGASLVDEVRKRFVPVMGKLDPVQLGRLATKMQKANKIRPSLEIPLKNEEINMLIGLQEAQDLYIAKKFKDLKAYLGSGSEDIVENLESLKDKPDRAKGVFDWIGNDIKDRSAWRLSKVRTPQNPGKAPEFEDRKNWRLLHRYFATNLDNMLPMLQTTYARTGLFILDCYLRQTVKFKKPLPPSLDAFSKSATIDPFTGKQFYYKVTGSTYSLYSAGEDGIDNLGETNNVQKSPDLLIEKP